MKSMLAGDPALGGVIATTARELVGTILPGKGRLTSRIRPGKRGDPK